MSFLIGGEILDIDLTWGKGGEFLIKDGLIFPTFTTLPVEYSPFDTKSQRPVYEAFAKLGKKMINNDKPENEVISFYKKYGPLDLYTFCKFKNIKYEYKTTYNNHSVFGERIIDIKNEAIRFYCLTQIYKYMEEIELECSLYNSKIIDKLFTVLKIISNLPYINGKILKWYDDEFFSHIVKKNNYISFINGISLILSGNFVFYLDGINPYLSFQGRKWDKQNTEEDEEYKLKPTISLTCPSLLNAIYLTYLNSMSTDKIGYCEICGGVLYKSSKNKRVHTDCSNRMRQKRHNKKSLQG